jgi:hypothetical protein
MKLLLVLSVLCQLGRSVAKDSIPEEFASQLYQKASEQVASFFKTAGTPVADYAHPSLRTEEAEFHPRATAHFTYYRDDKCTEIDYIIDYKISRCINFLSNRRIRIVSEDDSSWTLAFTSCENYLGVSSGTQFPKNTCVLFNRAYVTFNLIAQPLKSMPGGGAAFVFYDNQDDCQISKHTNLGRAETVLTIPMGICSTGAFGPVTIVSCDSTALTYQFYNDISCTQPAYQRSYSTVQAGSCAPYPDKLPYQVLCLTDSAAV